MQEMELIENSLAPIKAEIFIKNEDHPKNEFLS